VSTIRVVGSIICLLVGIVWIGQGIGLIGGSVMTNNSGWAVAGVVLLAIAAWQLSALIRTSRPR